MRQTPWPRALRRARFGGLKLSVLLLPERGADELLQAVELADDLGFHACYSADEIYHKDMWQLLAVAAGRTQRIRLGPCVAPILLREPTLVAQALATLDELSGGRAEGIFSIGNLAMLDQYGREWQADRPLLRLREAHAVIRTLLDTGTLDFEGELYRYRGVTTAARPVQERLPLLLGGMRGPRSYELAGEIADGVHSALSYTPEALEFVATAFRRGAERAGRDPRALDLAMNVLFAVSPDGAAAREVARSAVAFYLPSMPGELLARHGIDARTVEPILRAFGHGDVARAIELTTPALAARLSVAGTPEDVAERIAAMASHGFGHVSLTVADPALVGGWSGHRPAGVPGLAEQLQLVAEQVMPALSG